MGIKTKDTKLFVHAGGTSGSGLTEITDIREVETPDACNDDLEITNLASTDKEYMPGLGDGKKVAFKCGYSAGNFAALNALLALNDVTPFVPSTFEVIFSDNHGYTFQGYINKVYAKMDPNKEVIIESQIKVTGAVTAV